MSKTLQQKNTSHLLIWLPVVLIIGSLFFYAVLSMHSYHMQEKQLSLKQQNVWQAFAMTHSSVNMQIRGEYVIEEPGLIPNDMLNKPRDTALFYPSSGELIIFKILTQQYDKNGKVYQLTTYVSSKEIFHLIIKVFLTLTFIFLLLLLAIVIINRKSSQLLWRPFYRTLKGAASYDIILNPNFNAETNTGISEFDQLSIELNDLIEKANKAYNNQKQFVENASHEIQTPLAIIRSKLELLINEPGLTEKKAELLEDISDANERLSQMNKSLLLLAKIDNNQFPEKQQVNISELLKKLLNNYKEHYEQFPSLKTNIDADVFITASPALLEILFANLIKNAVVHNIFDGYIHVSLNETHCVIENTGNELTEDPELLFERFRKGAPDSKTTGLGLAIAKQITQLYDFGLSYQYQKGVHSIKISFEGLNLPNLS